MAFLGTNDLKAELPSIIIEEYEEKNIENACYNLRLGDEAYVTNSKIDKTQKLDKDNLTVRIDPGQFALLITLETVNIPPKLIGFISLRFSLKKKGLINVSGFHVDPGFSGKIVFSVYNAGPVTMYLEKGLNYFSIWFSELKSESGNYTGKFNKQHSIGASYLNDLNGNLPYPGTLLKKIKKNEDSYKMLLGLGGIIVTILLAAIGYLFAQNLKFSDGYNYKMREEQFKYQIDSIKTENRLYIKKLLDSTLKK